MNHHPAPQPAEQTPSDIDRYERLQAAAEKQIANSWEAYKRLINLLGIAISACTVIVVVGSVILFADIKGFKKETRDELDREEKRVEARIDEEFKVENIQKRIQERVSTVTDQVISNNIRAEIDPELARITTNISQLVAKLEAEIAPLSALSNSVIAAQKELADAQVAASDLREVTDLEMTITAASSDDALAFEKLIKLRDTGTNKYQLLIVKAITMIIGNVDNCTWMNSMREINYDIYKFKPETASLNDYIDLINSNAPVMKTQILKKLAAQDRFTWNEKMNLYAEIMAKPTSLMLRNEALTLMEKEAQIGENLLGAPDYLKWLESERLKRSKAK